MFDSSGEMLGHDCSAGAGGEESVSLIGLTPGAAYYAGVLGRNHDGGTGTFDIYMDFDLAVPLSISPGDVNWSISTSSPWQKSFWLRSGLLPGGTYLVAEIHAPLFRMPLT